MKDVQAMASSKATASTAQPEAWRGFKPGLWQRDINVRWFIQRNYTPYEGDGAFLAPAIERTRRLWKRLEELDDRALVHAGTEPLRFGLVNIV
jgi:formate C-acetyltransferase